MNRDRTDHIVLCSSETPPTEDIGLAELDSRDRKRGWFKCLYHFVVRRDGTIEHGLRAYHEHTMGLRRHNATSVSICIVGGKGEPPITDLQITSTKDLLAELLDEYPQAQVVDQHDLVRATPVELVKYFKEPTDGQSQPEDAHPGIPASD
jgi:N-acetylmuramoyl-L-alanine amidase